MCSMFGLPFARAAAAAILLLGANPALAEPSPVTGHETPADRSRPPPPSGPGRSRLPLVDPSVVPPGRSDPAQEPPAGEPGTATPAAPGQAAPPSSRQR
jgi:hypothetical protein